MKICFYRSNVEPMFSLSLLSSVPLFIFSQLCSLLFYFGLTLSFFLLCILFCISLSLSPYIFLEHFQKKKTEEEQGEVWYRSRHRSEFMDSWSKDRSIKRISSQLEGGIEWTRSETHLNSPCTISAVCNSAVNMSILLLLSWYYCCHYSSMNH